MTLFFPYKGLKSMADLWVKTEESTEKEKIMLKIALWINGFPDDYKFEINFRSHDDSMHIYTI